MLTCRIVLPMSITLKPHRLKIPALWTAQLNYCLSRLKATTPRAGSPGAQGMSLATDFRVKALSSITSFDAAKPAPVPTGCHIFW